MLTLPYITINQCPNLDSADPDLKAKSKMASRILKLYPHLAEPLELDDALVNSLK